MDIPLDHRPSVQVAVHLHELKIGETTERILDIRYWRTKKDGTRSKGGGVRIPLLQAEQLAIRLMRLYKRYQSSEDKKHGLVVDEFTQAAGIDWEGK